MRDVSPTRASPRAERLPISYYEEAATPCKPNDNIAQGRATPYFVLRGSSDALKGQQEHSPGTTDAKPRARKLAFMAEARRRKTKSKRSGALGKH